MSRVKRGKATHKRHKRLLKQTKGYWGQRSNVLRRAKETLRRAMAYAYVGRKLKKRDMRKLFITRINGALTEYGISYSSFMNSLKTKEVQLNRKMLSQISIFEPTVFAKIVEIAK